MVRLSIVPALIFAALAFMAAPDEVAEVPAPVQQEVQVVAFEMPTPTVATNMLEEELTPLEAQIRCQFVCVGSGWELWTPCWNGRSMTDCGSYLNLW